MKRCLACETTFQTPGWMCPSCGREPASIDGFTAFAPALAAGNQGYPAGRHATLEHIEAKTFWFRSRNRLIADLASRYFSAARNVMELGCGTGFVLGALRQALPAARLTGSEIDTHGLAIARGRTGDSVELIQVDALRLPYTGEFDLVCAFDVLEHITDDQHALSELHRALVPDGGALLAVPSIRSCGAEPMNSLITSAGIDAASWSKSAAPPGSTSCFRPRSCPACCR